MLFFQKTHTIFGTPNFGRRNPTPTRKTRKHYQNACTKKSQRSETVPRIRRILQEICSKIRRHFKSANTSNKKGRRIQVDTRMRKLLPDLKRISSTSTNTTIPQPPSQLHTLHRCIKICLRRCIDTT